MAISLKARREERALTTPSLLESSKGMVTGVYTLWLKHMLKFSNSVMEIGGTLFMPILWMVLFGVCMDSMFQEVKSTKFALGYEAFITPGVMLLTSLSAAVLGGSTLLLERINGVIKEYLVAPVPRLAILLGTLASGFTKAMLQSSIVLLLGLLLDHSLILSFGRVLAGLAVVAIFSLGFVGLAAAIASKANGMEGYHSLIMVLNLPLLFISNALYPLELMPGFIRVLAMFNPVTYAVDAIRFFFYGAKADIGLGVDFAVLVGFMVFGIWLGFRNFKKSLRTLAG